MYGAVASVAHIVAGSCYRATTVAPLQLCRTKISTVATLANDAFQYSLKARFVGLAMRSKR